MSHALSSCTNAPNLVERFPLFGAGKASVLLLWLVVCLLFCPMTLAAQVATGDVLGTVSDATGSIIPGASVRLENTGTHEVRTFTTGSDGGYVFSAVQPGTYSLTVASPTFKTFIESNVVLAAADRVRVNANLQAGGTEERVEVTATPSSLQTDETSVGSTITEKNLLDAPTIGRNYISLIQVQAGVNSGSAGSLSSGSAPTDRRLPSNVSANGQEELFNNNQIDGLDNNSRAIGAPLLRTSVEAIAETRTTTNLYPAEVGRTGGAAINVITKSGANQFHGSLYEFFRNDITDARNFFAPASVMAHKPELRQNQFGGSLSGPILRDRTFFFVDYEGLRAINGNNSVYTSTVPTLYEEQHPGDLSDQGGPVVPAASLNPTTLAYFKLFPAPNQFGREPIMERSTTSFTIPRQRSTSSWGMPGSIIILALTTRCSAATPTTARRRLRRPTCPMQMVWQPGETLPARVPATI